MARVEISHEAERDLYEIGLCVGDEAGAEIARRLLGKIDETCHLLARNPQMGELRKEFKSGLYRSFSVGNYVIYFCPIDDGIQVARVLHGARDHTALL